MVPDSVQKLDKQATLMLSACIPHSVAVKLLFFETLNLIGSSVCLKTITPFPNTPLLSITVLNVDCF